jgi:hypothetical protein
MTYTDVGLEGMEEGDFEPFRAVAWRCCDARRPGSPGREAKRLFEVICRKSIGGTAGEDLVVELGAKAPNEYCGAREIRVPVDIRRATSTDMRVGGKMCCLYGCMVAAAEATSRE